MDQKEISQKETTKRSKGLFEEAYTKLESLGFNNIKKTPETALEQNPKHQPNQKQNPERKEAYLDHIVD